MMELPKKEIELRIVRDEELPPIVITMDENDEIKVMINEMHKTWLAIHRKTIGGLSPVIYEKIDEILLATLKEARAFERLE
tara:strand:+ start:12564 stop:12806 length:243 start_codon:yes stop_codon:yes gene_type:complete